MIECFAIMTDSFIKVNNMPETLIDASMPNFQLNPESGNQ